jgi:hypothetical protein
MATFLQAHIHSKLVSVQSRPAHNPVQHGVLKTGKLPLKAFRVTHVYVCVTPMMLLAACMLEIAAMQKQPRSQTLVVLLHIRSSKICEPQVYHAGAATLAIIYHCSMKLFTLRLRKSWL